MRGEDAESRFTALYRDTAQDIFAFLLRRCATAEDAADCLAETYAIAWDKRERIPAATDARPWLFGVARNVMRRAHERDGRADATARELAAALADAAPTARLPSQNRDDPDDLVLDALAELSAIDREIITLIVWDGLKPTDVGVVLEMSPNLVRVRAHRARAKLRTILAASSKSAEATTWQSAASSLALTTATTPSRSAHPSENPDRETDGA